VGKRVLVIERQREDGTIQIALLEDRKLIELHQEREEDPYTVGDLYIGVVRVLSRPLNAAFVDLGSDRPGFLHYTDLGPRILAQQKFLRVAYYNKQKNLPSDFVTVPSISKEGSIHKILKIGEPILVQIMKEPISSKGPRLKSHLTLPGFYLILIPFDTKIRVSRKIQSQEKRKEYRTFFEKRLPDQFGLIVRTAAENVPFSTLESELNQLLNKWDQITETLTQLNKKDQKLPTRVYKESNRYLTHIRDLMKEGLDEIVVGDEALFHQLKTNLLMENPEMVDRIRYLRTKSDLFEYYDLYRQIKRAFGKTVTLPNGLTLVIEHTEAVHTIDVNSGARLKKDLDTEQMALQTNLSAVEEIAYQIRLRDMGGIIIIDFIDLKQAENRKKVYEALKQAVAKDRAKVKVLPMSPFGIVEMTRQRVRPQIEIKTEAPCPCCQGKGKMEDPILLIDQIEQELMEYIKTTNRFFITLYVHPYVNSYLKAHPFRYFLKWLVLHGRWVKIRSDSRLSFLSFRLEPKN
jgi:ribonuclease G